MTLELIIFIFLSLFLIISCTIVSNSKWLSYIYILLSAVYIITVRLSGFHDDLINYSENLKFPIATKFTFYYLKESFYWLLSTLIYSIVKNEVVTFLIFDFFCLYLLINICKKFNLPSYFILFYYLMFPSVMGFQNVYRQFIATIILLYSISLSFKNDKRKFIFFIASVFTHNTTLLTLPLIYLLNPVKKSFHFLAGILIVFIVFFLESKTKSYSSHGLSLGLIYILVIFLLSFFLFSTKIRTPEFKSIKVSIYSVYLTLLVFFMYFFLGESQSERLSMMAIQLLMPFICIYIDKFYKEKRVLRVAFVFILILPVFLFENAFSLLLNLI